MSLAIVSPAASSVPPALALGFHETASACESRSTCLVSFAERSPPPPWLCRTNGDPPCGGPTEAARRAVSHSNSVPVGNERNNSPVWLMDSYNPLSFRRSAPARASASLHRHKPIDPKSELAHGKGRDKINNGIVFSVTGDLRMSLLMWCMLILFLCSSSKEMVVDRTRLARWHSYQMEKPQNIIRNLKRHSDGTFASDFTHYLDKIKAKDFVEWLASTKQEGQAVKTYTFILKLCVL
ncbi:putative glucagon-like [Scophthalmus maximus]|uniref:Putative glucagon-like n=1 Tax=Scophthalmus maximus TaxID=52904 RepID=A0A2U9C0X6_SCOMX|nr:putative glucagon-like [Scophthalmus maximus]